MAGESQTGWRAAFAEFERLQTLDEKCRAAEMERLRQDYPTWYPQLETLIRADADSIAAGFLADPARPPLSWTEQPALVAHQVLGPYRLERPLGSGGMGEVWLARRADGLFEAPVALKLLHVHLARSSARARFVREGRILGEMAHAGIARLLDAGVLPGGQLYLAIEYVDGLRIDQWCDQRKLDVRGRVGLFTQVCEAVSHAHAHLVVHRDLKPSNILVTTSGEVKLLDFGIAKLVENEDGEALETELTRLGGRALTPYYAAPEQIGSGVITVATDVYSLGALLYTLLSGQRPYGNASRTMSQIERDVLETEAAPMGQARPSGEESAIAQALAAARSSTPARLRAALRGDLDIIVAKALKKQPEHRYAGVVDLANDLRRYLAEQPVLARRDSLRYRAAKFRRRHRRAVAMAAALTVLAIAGGLRSMRAAQQDHLDRLVEQGRLQLLAGHGPRAAVYLAAAFEQGRDSAALRFMLGQAMQGVDAVTATHFDAGVHNYFQALIYSPDGSQIFALQNVIGGSGIGPLRQGLQVRDAASGVLIRAFADEPFTQPGPTALALNPDGHHLLLDQRTTTPDKDVRHVEVWDSQSGDRVARFEGTTTSFRAKTDYETAILTGGRPFSADGGVLALVSPLGEVQLGNWRAPGDLPVLAESGDAVSANFSPDGTLLVTAHEDGSARLWDPVRRHVIRTLRPDWTGRAYAIFTPDGAHVVVANERGDVSVWRTEGDHPPARFATDSEELRFLDFSADGRRMATIGRQGYRVWDVARGALLFAHDSAPERSIPPIRLDATGDQLLLLGGSNDAEIFNVISGKQLSSLNVRGEPLSWATFSPDGRRLLMATENGSVDVWRTDFRPLLTVRHEGLMRSARFDHSGRRFVTTGGNRPTARVWDAFDGHPLAELRGHTAGVSWAEFSPDDRRVATAGYDRTARIWDAVSGRQLLLLDDSHGLAPYEETFSSARRTASFSPDGRRVVTLLEKPLREEPHVATIWDAGDGRRVATLTGHTATLNRAQFSPDSRRVATSGRDHTLRWWDAESGQLLKVFDDYTGARSTVAVDWTADGRRILTTSFRGPIIVRDAIDGAPLNRMEASPAGEFMSAEFSPDGRRIAIATYRGNALIWTPGTASVLTLTDGDHGDAVYEARFLHGGDLLLTYRGDAREAEVWDSVTGTKLARVAVANARIWDVDLDVERERLLVGSWDGTASVWSLHAESRSAATIGALLRCRVPWKIDGESLAPQTPTSVCTEAPQPPAVALEN